MAVGLLSSCGTRALEWAGSVVVACGLSCPVACGILVPRPGIKPTSPALEGGLLTTGPLGKSLVYDFMKYLFSALELLNLGYFREREALFIYLYLCHTH